MPVFIEIIGYIGAFFISIAFLPQTYKLLKTRDTKGLSLTSYLIYQLGLTLFIIYASFGQNWPLLAANSFGWIVNIILVSLICYNLYKAKKLNPPKDRLKINQIRKQLYKAKKLNPPKDNGDKKNNEVK